MKCTVRISNCNVSRRSRLGAWIEIGLADKIKDAIRRRSRLGAWIEIARLSAYSPDLFSRSRLGAWIEITCSDFG